MGIKTFLTILSTVSFFCNESVFANQNNVHMHMLNTYSIGLNIRGPMEQELNEYLRKGGDCDPDPNKGCSYSKLISGRPGSLWITLPLASLSDGQFVLSSTSFFQVNLPKDSSEALYDLMLKAGIKPITKSDGTISVRGKYVFCNLFKASGYVCVLGG